MEHLDAFIAAVAAWFDSLLDPAWFGKDGQGISSGRALVMVAVLLGPLVIALASRRVLGFVAVSLLMFIAFRAYVDPSSLHALTAPSIYIAGLFVALIQAVSARRHRRLQAELAELRAQIDGLRQAEQRRFMIDLKTSSQAPQAPETAGDEPVPRA